MLTNEDDNLTKKLVNYIELPLKGAKKKQTFTLMLLRLEIRG